MDDQAIKLAEHVRAVNFFLIAFTLALAIIIVSSTPSETERALSSIQKIREILDHLDPQQMLVDLEQRERWLVTVSTAEESTAPPRELLINVDLPRRLLPSEQMRVVMQATPLYTAYQADTLTLSQFREFWEQMMEVSALSVRYPESAPITGLIQQTGAPAQLRFQQVSTSVSPPAAAEQYDATAELTADSAFVKSHDQLEPTLDALPRKLLELRLHPAMPQPFTVHAAIAGVDIGGSTQRVQNLRILTRDVLDRETLGTFSTTFPELAEIAQEDTTIRLDALQESLKKEVEEVQQISFGGVSITRGIAKRWGLGAMLLVQIYLLVHIRRLRELLHPHSPAWYVPWNGLYPGALAAAVAYASTAILPALLALTVAAYATEDVSLRSAGVSVFLLTAASWILALLTARALWRLRDHQSY